MKVKVRGLVFVGFAAAVFATSAMAEVDADKKTVTSKYYVDQTFQTLAKEVGIGGTGQSANITALKQTDDWTSNTKYPSMKVLSSAISDAEISVAGETNKIAVDHTGNTYTVTVDNPSTQASDVTSANDAHLITSGGVRDYAQDKREIVASINNDSTDTTNYNGNSTTKYTSVAAVTGYAEATANKLAYNNGETITANKTSDVKFPTAKNVYEFVKAENAAYQPKVSTASTTSAVQIGYKADANSEATWGTLAGTDYVTISGSNGTYTANVDGTKIADEASEITSSSTNLATAGAVYDYVSGNYQAKATTGADTVEVGHNGGWTTLAGGNSYITVAYDGTTDNRAEVSLTGVASNTSSVAASNTDLITGGVVYSLKDNTLSSATTGNDAETNDTLPTSKAVVDYVASFGLSSTLPSECSTANSDHVCALVAYYDTTTTSVKYEWTVMAPTGN